MATLHFPVELVVIIITIIIIIIIIIIIQNLEIEKGEARSP